MLVIKRDGSEVVFDRSKIENAIRKANTSVNEEERLIEDDLITIVDDVVDWAEKEGRPVSVEEIQDKVEQHIFEKNHYHLGKSYTIYRYQHAQKRDGLIDSVEATDFFKKMKAIVEDKDDTTKEENANKNPTIIPTKRDYMAGEVSKFMIKLKYPKYLLDAHDEGIIHIHDTDYEILPMYNCSLVNLDDMLQNGTVINGYAIDKPRSFSTACNVATQILAQVASSQYGGNTINLYHISKFVEVSRTKLREQIISELERTGIRYDSEDVDKIVEIRLKREIDSGVQTIQYQILTLMTTNGQTPFNSVFIYLGEAESELEKKNYALVIESFIKQRILGIKNKAGVYIPATFPKILYVLEDDNIEEDAPYFYLTKLAAECTAKRMVPDYISEKKMKEFKDGNVYGCMGCRSFLSVWKDPNTGKAKFWGRYNKGVVTINLPDVALTALDWYEEQKNNNQSKFNPEDEISKFWEILDERLEMCHEALKLRWQKLIGVKSDVSPILWQYGAIARLKPGETIDSTIFGGYSTTSLGYVGLWETVKVLTGKSHTDPEVKDFSLSIVKYMKDKCDAWNAIENVGYSLYGTPEESTTYKFAKALKRRHSRIIEGVNDKNWVTNSYHTDIREKVDIFTKIIQESDFQKDTNGGAIIYGEIPNMVNNIPALIEILKCIHNYALYAELNCKIDYCLKCGYSGEISLVENEHHKLIWKCPQCGNTDNDSMNIIRRVCGYLSSNLMNQGRLADIKNRVLHL